MSSAGSVDSRKFWVLHNVPGCLSVASVLRTLTPVCGDSLTVVDRMLGMGKLIFATSPTAPAPTLPTDWAMDLGMFVKSYEKDLTPATEERQNSDVIIVHCVRDVGSQGKTLPEEIQMCEARACLNEIGFPLHNALRVFTTCRRSKPRRSIGKRWRSTDYEHLTQIYVQMKSVEIARNCVPGTDPLIPAWDAVPCESNSSCLHVLQQSNKLFARGRKVDVWEVPEGVYPPQPCPFTTLSALQGLACPPAPDADISDSAAGDSASVASMPPLCGAPFFAECPPDVATPTSDLGDATVCSAEGDDEVGGGDVCVAGSRSGCGSQALSDVSCGSLRQLVARTLPSGACDIAFAIGSDDVSRTYGGQAGSSESDDPWSDVDETDRPTTGYINCEPTESSSEAASNGSYPCATRSAGQATPHDGAGLVVGVGGGGAGGGGSGSAAELPPPGVLQGSRVMMGRLPPAHLVLQGGKAVGFEVEEYMSYL